MFPARFVFRTAVLWAAGVVSLDAQIPAVTIPADGRDLVAPGAASPNLPQEPGIAAAKTVRAKDAPGGEFWRFDIKKPGANPWSIQLGAKVGGPIAKGDALLLTFYARAVEGRASGGMTLENRTEGYPKLGASSFRVGTKWQPINIPFTAAEDAVDGKCHVGINLGAIAQQVDISGLRLLNYGKEFPLEKLPQPTFTYEGREPDAPWRKEALARIEKLRKGDFGIALVDKNGQPVPGADIRVMLKRHAFGFGSAVTVKWLTDASADGERYRAIVDECFSRVVFENDLKPWAWQQAKRDKGKMASLDKSFAWLAERHIEVRGHYLCWAPFEEWSEKLKGNPQALRDKIFADMRDIAPAIGDRVVEWDALNHPAAWSKGICIDTVLGRDFFAEVFKEARKLTKLPLWINEDQVFRPGYQSDEYFAIIQKLLADGVKVDGIGNQAHFHDSYLPSPDEMLANSDRFSKLVPALELTEYDVVTKDEQLAADFTRDILITTFSDPAYTGMVMWGFWENAHWRPDGALWRKDWSEKPAVKAWRDLVCGQWKTQGATKTDAQGRVRLRGFFGRYEVAVTHGGATSTHSVVLGSGANAVQKIALP